MSEMIKRVAKVIEAELEEESPKFIWAERIARVAIEAMREPTLEILDAVYGQQGETNGSDEPARRLWQAMISAALSRS